MIKAEEHLNLVHYVLRHYFGFKPNSCNYEDLYQTGCYALTYCAKKFKAEKGYTFSTYAIPSISGHIKRYLREDSLIHYNRSVMDLRGNYCKYLSEGYTNEEIAKKLNITDAKLQDVLQTLQPLESFDFIMDDGGSIYEVRAGKIDVEEDSISKLELQERIKIIKLIPIKNLNDVINLMLQDITKQTQISKILNISQSYVSRIILNFKRDIVPILNQYFDGRISYEVLSKKLNLGGKIHERKKTRVSQD